MPEHDPRRELIDASKSALARLRGYIDECGPCDHDVNICVCEIIRDAERLAAAIEAMEAKTAEPAQQLRTCCIGCGELHERPMSSYCQRCSEDRAREFDHHVGLSRP